MVRQCPRCNSTHIEADISAMSFGEGTFFNSYLCQQCGYRGMFFPDVDQEEEK